MGDAKRRGDYEKRKAQAIKAGRVKVHRPREHRLATGPSLLAGILGLMSFGRDQRQSRRAVR